MASSSGQLVAIVEALRPVSIGPGTITVEAEDLWLNRVASRTPELEAVFTRAAGTPMKLRVVAAVPRAPEPGDEAAGPGGGLPMPRASPTEHPLVKKALSLLGGNVARVMGRPRELDDPERAGAGPPPPPPSPPADQ